MLGDIVSKAENSFFKPVSSGKLVNAIVDNWNDKFIVYPATLEKQNQTWKEFWLSASDVANWCPRASAISALFGPFEREIDMESLWSMGQGTSMHNLFQTDIFIKAYKEKFLGSWGYGNMIMEDNLRMRHKDRSIMHSDVSIYGDEDIREIVRPILRDPKEYMPNPYFYVEPKYRYPKYRMVVKLDGVVDCDNYLEIQEIKTERLDNRSQLDISEGGSPRDKHIQQCQVAMLVTGIRKSRLIYVFKGLATLRQSILEYEIDYDNDMAIKLKRTAEECVKSVYICDQWKKEYVVPSTDVEDFNLRLEFLDQFKRYEECPMKSKGRASRCPSRDLCFAKKKAA